MILSISSYHKRSLDLLICNFETILAARVLDRPMSFDEHDCSQLLTTKPTSAGQIDRSRTSTEI